jgi:hypothetical protein
VRLGSGRGIQRYPPDMWVGFFALFRGISETVIAFEPGAASTPGATPRAAPGNRAIGAEY